MACLIILFNWFPLSISGFVVALWHTTYFFIPFVAESFKYDTSNNYLVGCLVVGGLYIILAVICQIYFHHHPSHIGIKVQTNAKSSGSGGNFFVLA
jgi:sugar phosphate permease